MRSSRHFLFGRVLAAHGNVDQCGENGGDRDREQDGEAAEEDPDCEYRHEHEQGREANRVPEHARQDQVVLEQAHD